LGWHLTRRRSPISLSAVKVTDNGKPTPKSDTAEVEIRLIDVNEAPKFYHSEGKNTFIRLIEENGLRKNELKMVGVEGWDNGNDRSVAPLDGFGGSAIPLSDNGDEFIIMALPPFFKNSGVSLLVGAQPVKHTAGNLEFEITSNAIVYVAVNPKYSSCPTSTCNTCSLKCPLGDSWISSGMYLKVESRGTLSGFLIYSKQFLSTEVVAVDLDATYGVTESVIIVFVGPYMESNSSECQMKLGVREGELLLPLSSMSSNIAGTVFPSQRYGGWKLGGASGTSLLATGQNYYQIDLLSEYSVSGAEHTIKKDRGVAKFKVATSLNGKSFKFIKNHFGETAIFSTTFGVESTPTNFYRARQSRYVRIYPVQCLQSCEFDFEIIGGAVEQCQDIMGKSLDGGELVVIDNDGLTNPEWSHLSYTILAGDIGGAFCFPDANKGTLNVCNPLGLNYEKRSRVVLTVQVSDNGSPILKDTTSVTILVADLNEAPVFLSTDREVNENSVEGSTVGEPVTAIDVDEGDQSTLHYTIQNSTGSPNFMIDEKRGQIYVSATGAEEGALNFERISNYTLKIKVRDYMGLSDVGEVFVIVRDVNEKPIVPDTSRMVNESSKVGDIVGDPILAFDIDSGMNGVPAFEIIEQQKCSIVDSGSCSELKFTLFAINPVTGQISVLSMLHEDERHALNFEKNEYFKITVKAEDIGLLSSSGVVTIHMLDINEAPEFHALNSPNQDLFENMTSSMTITNDAGIKEMVRGARVSENSLEGTSVGWVVADPVDQDKLLFYKIAGGDSFGIFAISNEGHVRVNKESIDFEFNNRFVLVVHAMDIEGLSAAVEFIILVDDVNEAPVYRSDFSGQIVENSASGSPIGVPVLAFDEDEITRTTAIDFWANIKQSKCMMQWGKIPFLRASSKSEISLDLKDPLAKGWVQDIAEKIVIKDSSNVYVPEDASAPSNSIFRNTNHNFGCYFLDMEYFTEVEKRVSTKSDTESLHYCEDSARLAQSSFFAFGMREKCFLAKNASSIKCSGPESCKFTKGVANTCSMGTGGLDSVNIYKTEDGTRVSRTCTEMQTQRSTATSRIYTIQPDKMDKSVQSLCDTKTDNGGWTLIGYALDGVIGGPLWKKSGEISVNSPMESWVVGGALDIIRESTEVAISWSEESHDFDGISSFQNSVKFNIPFPTRQTLEPTINTYDCTSSKYVEVNVTCIQGNCDMPNRMFTRSTSLGTAGGRAYGLVAPKGNKCDSDPDNFDATIQISLYGEGGSGGVRGLTGKMIDRKFLAIWTRGESVKTDDVFKRVAGKGECAFYHGGGSQRVSLSGADAVLLPVRDNMALFHDKAHPYVTNIPESLKGGSALVVSHNSIKKGVSLTVKHSLPGVLYIAFDSSGSYERSGGFENLGSTMAMG
jgi:hypothetical protein